MVEIIDDKGRGKAIRGLLDSGCSRTIILKEFCSQQQPGDKIIYQAYGGTVTCMATSIPELKLPEFSNSK